MPSASSKTAANSIPPINMPDLLHEPIKNVVCVLDKKLRNLEKRKIKLVETKKKAEEGSELNEDQRKALENLTLVDNSLNTVKEVHKNLTTLEQEYLKLLKRDQKRVKQEQKEQSESKSQETVTQTIQIQAILGELTEEVRPDFLAGTNTACLLTAKDLANLDSFYELINLQSVSKSKTNFTNHVKEVSSHLFSVIEAKEKDAVEGITYKEINEVLARIQACGYFDKVDEVAEVAVEEVEEVVVEEVKEEEEVEEELVSLEEVEEEIPLESEPNELISFTENDSPTPAEEFSTPDMEPTSEPYAIEEETNNEEVVVVAEVAEVETAPIVHMEAINGVDLPPEVQQQAPDNERIDFMGESEISPAMLESQQQSLNPVSPEFIPRNMQLVSDEAPNGWAEPPTAAAAAAAAVAPSNEWTETPSADNEWQAVPDFNQNNPGFRGRGGRGGGRGFGRGGRGRGGGGGGGFRGGRQDGNYGNRENYRGGNRGGRGGGRGEGRGGSRGGNRGRGDGSRGGRGSFGGADRGTFNRSAPAPAPAPQ